MKPARLDPRDIEAACQLFASMDSWRQTDEALAVVARQMPGFGLPETLVKVTLVNTLYYTGVLSTPRVAVHFHRVISESDRAQWNSETVESLAAVHLNSSSEKPARCISLASKFAHFFMDSRRFPIYDKYALRMLAELTGRNNKTLANAYSDFCAAHSELCQQIGVEDVPRRLDHYLWVQGQYEEFRTSGKAGSAELTRIFQAGRWSPTHAK